MCRAKIKRSVEIVEEGSEFLSRCANIPTSFRVEAYYQATREKDGEFTLVSNTVSPAYLKDYDAADGTGLLSCQSRWNLVNWGFLSAVVEDECVGSAVIAFDTECVDMLENRKDLSVLWDIRVHPDFRYQNVGSLLFEAACTWSLQRNCTVLKVETQNTNVPACNFYKKQNCKLRRVTLGVYPDQADDLQLLWYKNLMAWK